MATLPVYDKSGSQVGTYDIDPTDLCETIDKQLLHDAAVMYQANLRQGSFKTKSRAEIAGSMKKLYRQKGTGNARPGTRKSGLRRGGGHIFAKRPRDFSYRLPRKALQKATRMALAGKLRDDQVVVIEELSQTEPKTSEMAAVLKALNIGGISTLVALEAHDAVIYKSIRNLPKVDVLPVCDLNALSILKPQRVLITRAALDAMKEGTANQTKAEVEAAAG